MQTRLWLWLDESWSQRPSWRCRNRGLSSDWRLAVDPPPPSPIALFPNSVQSEGFTRGIACRGKGLTLDPIHTALLHLSHKHARKALSLVLCSPHTKMDRTGRSSRWERSRQILNDSTSVQSSKRGTWAITLIKTRSPDLIRCEVSPFLSWGSEAET